MIACVSPGKNSADHTINTLRYADRLKDKSALDYDAALKKQEDREKAKFAEPMQDIPKAEPISPKNRAPIPGKRKSEIKEEPKENVEPSLSEAMEGPAEPRVEDDWQYLKKTLNVRDGNAFK